MRTTITGLLVLATACTQAANADPTDPGITRPQRQSILRQADDLHGVAIAQQERGGWTLRIARAGGKELADAAPGKARVDRLAADLAAAGEAGGGPAAAPTAAPTAVLARSEAVEHERAATGADDFYLGAAEPRDVAKAGTSALRRMHARGPGSAGPVQPLRAGSTDDNEEFDAFLGFLIKARANEALRRGFVDLDVSGRCFLQVVDAQGDVVPGAEVRIVDEANDRVVWRGTTYGDGRVPFYPAVANGAEQPAGSYLVEVPVGERIVRHVWNGRDDMTVRLPGLRSEAPLALDVAFLIDTTGSMGDEIAAIKATLLQVTERLRSLDREFDLRYGAVLYRDVGDEYVTAQHDFTGDIEAFDTLLRGVCADGGGDGPESLNQGLAVTIDGMTWRDHAAKVTFLIADAPPHLDYDNDVAYDRSLAAAVARGVRVHTVAASGLDQAGSVVFRQIAQFTRGEFVFLEYGNDLGGSAAAHGVKQATGNNLDDILYTRIRDEIAHWGRDPDAEPAAAPADAR